MAPADEPPDERGALALHVLPALTRPSPGVAGRRRCSIDDDNHLDDDVIELTEGVRDLIDDVADLIAGVGDLGPDVSDPDGGVGDLIDEVAGVTQGVGDLIDGACHVDDEVGDATGEAADLSRGAPTLFEAAGP